MRRIFNTFLGNATSANVEEVEQSVQVVLLEGEIVEHAYQTIRDMIVFTNKRLLTVNVQGVSGKRVDYFTIPYKSISHFSVETASTMELGTDLCVWIKGLEDPIRHSFNKSDGIFSVQKVLAGYIL